MISAKRIASPNFEPVVASRHARIFPELLQDVLGFSRQQEPAEPLEVLVHVEAKVRNEQLVRDLLGVPVDFFILA